MDFPQLLSALAQQARKIYTRACPHFKMVMKMR